LRRFRWLVPMSSIDGPVNGLSHGLEELRDSIAQTAEAAPKVARQEVLREGRAYFRGAVVASVVTSLLVGIPLALLAHQFTEYTTADKARAAQFESSAADIRRLAEGAHDLGTKANAELARRGLETIPIPAPGTAPDSQVLTAASTAQVAAKIASESVGVPAPEQVRAEIAAQLADLPPPPAGPSPQQLDDAVRAYVTTNLESLRGPQGEQGRPGGSPPCLAEPTQCRGAQGEPGLRGEPPMGWTVEEADGSITACERVTPFDPAAPRYRCAHTASPTPTTERLPPSGGEVLQKPGG
jgi:hypothetical protein